MGDTSEQEDGFGMFEEPKDFRPPAPANTVHRVTRVTGDPDLVIELVGFHSLWAHCLWNAGVALSEYFDEHPEIVSRKCILELGAGAGLPSMVAALNNASVVVCTDYPEEIIISNLLKNLKQNIKSEPDFSQRVHAKGYLWGADVRPLLAHLPPESPRFDIVILADLIFNHSEHHKMLQTVITSLSNSVTAMAIVAFTHHRPHLAESDMKFFTLAIDFYGLQCEHLWDRKKPAMFPEDPGDEGVRSTIHCYRLQIPKDWSVSNIKWPADTEEADNLKTEAFKILK